MGSFGPSLHRSALEALEKDTGQNYIPRDPKTVGGREGEGEQRKMAATVKGVRDRPPDRKTEQAEHVDDTTAQTHAEKTGSSPASLRLGGTSGSWWLLRTQGRRILAGVRTRPMHPWPRCRDKRQTG